MAAPTRIVSLNLGMQTVTLAEFHATPDGAITLNACKQEELIVDPAADVTRPAQIESAVENLRKQLKLPAKLPINFCLPSQAVFARFVKLAGWTASTELRSPAKGEAPGAGACSSIPFFTAFSAVPASHRSPAARAALRRS